jgi:hypothetical protein
MWKRELFSSIIQSSHGLWFAQTKQVSEYYRDSYILSGESDNVTGGDNVDEKEDAPLNVCKKRLHERECSNKLKLHTDSKNNPRACKTNKLINA